MNILQKDPRIVRRYFLFCAYLISIPLGRRLSRRKVVKEIQARKKAISEAHSSVVSAFRKHRKLKLRRLSAIHNATLFLLNANRDLLAIQEELMYARDPWARRYFARQLALVIYETDLTKVFGKQFNQAVELVSPSQEWRDQFAAAFRAHRKSLTDLKPVFSDLRNYVTAHRDGDAWRQYHIIRTVREMDVLQRTGEFYRPISQITTCLTQLMLLASNQSVMLKDLLTTP